MSSRDITSLISGLQRTDPVLYQTLKQLNDRMVQVEEELFPLTRAAQEVSTTTANLTPPELFTFSFTQRTVRFNWSSVPGALQYEVRKGTSWNTASFQFRVVSLQADIDALETGSHTFLIKSLDNGGNYSSNFTICVVTVPDIGLISITNQVIDNNILLSWTTPSSVFEISHYEVYREDVLIGTLLGTFFVRFEALAGTFEFKVVAVDIAGNRSPEATVDVAVSAPPDFELQDRRLLTFNGTKVNTQKEGTNSLLAPPNTSESWTQHFSSRNWATPQAQMDAGFPIFIQPTANEGTYVETIDYGSVFNNIIVTYNWQSEVIIDGVTMVISTRTSVDGSSWSSPIVGSSFFATTFRHLEITLTFTPTA